MSAAANRRPVPAAFEALQALAAHGRVQAPAELVDLHCAWTANGALAPRRWSGERELNGRALKHAS